MASTRITTLLIVILLVVGFVSGYFVGFTIHRPQISQMQSDLSKTQSVLLESQSQIQSLQRQLTEAQNEKDDLLMKLTETKNEIASLKKSIIAKNEASVLLEKDLAFLERLYELMSDKKTLREELALWSDVRESSSEVDSTLPSKIDAIVDNVKEMSDWTERTLQDYANWEELALYEIEGRYLMSQWKEYYSAFETTYISAIQRHIEASIQQD